MAKGGGGSIGRYSINLGKGDDSFDGSSLDQALQDRGLAVSGNGGNDTLRGGSGGDLLSGGIGNDTIVGDLEDLQRAGGDGKVVWDGGNGTDTLDLSGLSYAPGTGTMVAFYVGGDSQIRTSAGNPSAYAEPTTWDAIYRGNFTGFENFILGDGNDTVIMSNNAAANVIRGGGGNDLIRSLSGNDTVYGDAGNDILDGGWGDDIVSGGTGSDAFVWEGRLAGQYTRDTVTDFDIDASDGTQDQIWLGHGWTIQWDPNSAVLHGYLVDGSTVFGEVTLQNLTYADAASVQIVALDGTGYPLIV
jgi:Ca2+-binding RTX toxin-like protein